jgi:hypothetical protein
MNIPQLRLHNQQIARQQFRTPGEVVAWLGALQGQDYAGAKWSVGLRLPGCTDADVEQAIADKIVLRTWLMRSTLHLVNVADIRWMTALVAPRLLVNTRRYQQLELDEATLARSDILLASALADGKELTRSALFNVLEAEGLSTKGQRGYHMLIHASLNGLICQNVSVRSNPTFMTMPASAMLTRDEAAAELARRYFTSRGPATLKDFMWWSGLIASEARAGLEAAKSSLVEEKIGGHSYWLPAAAESPNGAPSAYLLPGFDEYLLGYTDRSAVLDAQHAQKVCPGGNGIFFPTIVIDWQMVGTWKYMVKKGMAVMTPTPFDALTPAQVEQFAEAAQPFGNYLGLPVVLS